MDIRPITPAYAVSPQISPEDAGAIAAAGYRMILCNRPDAEVPPPLQTGAIRAAAEAAGLAFVDNPVVHAALNDPEARDALVQAQSQAIEQAGGPVLAYCASGTRSTVVWSLGQAGSMEAEEIIAAAGRAGYDMSGLRPHLSAGD